MAGPLMAEMEYVAIAYNGTAQMRIGHEVYCFYGDQ